MTGAFACEHLPTIAGLQPIMMEHTVVRHRTYSASPAAPPLYSSRTFGLDVQRRRPGIRQHIPQQKGESGISDTRLTGVHLESGSGCCVNLGTAMAMPTGARCPGPHTSTVHLILQVGRQPRPLDVFAFGNSRVTCCRRSPQARSSIKPRMVVPASCFAVGSHGAAPTRNFG